MGWDLCNRTILIYHSAFPIIKGVFCTQVLRAFIDVEKIGTAKHFCFIAICKFGLSADFTPETKFIPVLPHTAFFSCAVYVNTEKY